jgi:hypothetical protein
VRRNYNKVFVDGPSGSGKTRMGWELYSHLVREVKQPQDGATLPPLKIDAVSYAFLNMTDSLLSDSVVDVMEADKLERLLADILVEQLSDIKPAPGSTVTLHSVLRHILNVRPGGSKRGALVLHIDEFHREPKQTVRLLSVVRQFSKRHATSTLILPVCTGLYTDHCFGPNVVSGNSRRVVLGFFQDLQKTWEIVRGAAMGLSGNRLPPLLLDVDVDSAPPNVRYLVEDTGGWAMAAVQLGVNIATRDLSRDEPASALIKVEDAVVGKLKEVYPSDALRAALGEIGKAALFKVATLALSPFSVGCHVWAHQIPDMTRTLPLTPCSTDISLRAHQRNHRQGH